MITLLIFLGIVFVFGFVLLLIGEIPQYFGIKNTNFEDDKIMPLSSDIIFILNTSWNDITNSSNLHNIFWSDMDESDHDMKIKELVKRIKQSEKWRNKYGF